MITIVDNDSNKKESNNSKNKEREKKEKKVGALQGYINFCGAIFILRSIKCV